MGSTRFNRRCLTNLLAPRVRCVWTEWARPTSWGTTRWDLPHNVRLAHEAQIQENQRQLEQLSSENKKLLNQIDKNSKEKLDLERKRISLEEQKIRDNKDYNDRVIDTKEKQIQVEQTQLYDSNPYNNKIKTNI